MKHIGHGLLIAFVGLVLFIVIKDAFWILGAIVLFMVRKLFIVRFLRRKPKLDRSIARYGNDSDTEVAYPFI